MRSVAVFTVFSVFALGAASSAIADGTPGSLTPAPVVRDGWSGLYIGLGGGASRVDHSSRVDTDVTKQKEKCHFKKVKNGKGYCEWEEWGNPYTQHLQSLFSEDDTTGFGTIQVGYDHLLGHHLLIGAFADVDIYFAGDDQDLDLNHTWNIGGRLGVLVAPRVLLYGVGGYTQAGIDNTIQISNGPKLGDFDNPRGWFAGGGGEVKLHRGVSLKLEYRYADYGSFDDGGSLSTTSASYWKYGKKFRHVTTVDSSADDDLEVQSVRALVVFRLDEPDAPVPLK
jgi:opacity protein-like surface antigen